MSAEVNDVQSRFDRGAVILSFDTEQIWGYLDQLNEGQFRVRYPDAIGAHERLLASLCRAGVSATWFVVGGMALPASEGASDRSMVGLPPAWTARIPRGAEATMPLWYRRSFIDHLRRANPLQEVGLHGGLTHLIWTDSHSTEDVVRRELDEGVKALEYAQVQPSSFSFGREQEAHHHLLLRHGIRSYRSRTATAAYQLGPTFRGAVARLLDEIRRATPPPVWPQEVLPGLWDIPSSLFLYPIGPTRTRITGLQSRVERFHRGLIAAARYRGIFHFCLHPENLTESRHGFSVFEDMMERLLRARDLGDVEILTMTDVVNRMERGRDPGLSVRAGASAPILERTSS